MFLPAPARIKYHYGAWQKRLAQVEAANPRFEFVEGLPISDDLPVGSEHTLMVIDDSMEEVSKSTTAMDIFTKNSHHRDMAVLFLVQKLYGWAHNTIVISQNAHRAILFKNTQDASSVQTFGRQIYPGNNMFLCEVFIDATKRPHYFVIRIGKPTSIINHSYIH